MAPVDGSDDPRRPFYRLSAYLAQRYGGKTYKVSLHCGFSCPNRDGTLATGGCSFCLGDALVPVGYEPGQSVGEQLAAGMEYIRRRHGARRFIAYYQDYTATHADPQRLAALYRPALEEPDVVALAVSTRPDCVPQPVLELLAATARQKDLWVELGLQIADDGVLAALGRGHDVAQFCDAVRTLGRSSLPVCAHVIIGLPGVTPAQELATAELLADLGVWGVKLHAFHVLAGTAMARLHSRGALELLSLDEHAGRVVDFVERLPPDTVIHRITAEAPRRLTLAPDWIGNKLAAYDRVVAAFAKRTTWQGRRAAHKNRSHDLHDS